MLFYVILVALANLSLGYAVGVYLGFGPRAVGELEIQMPFQNAPESADSPAWADKASAASTTGGNAISAADVEAGPDELFSASDKRAEESSRDIVEVNGDSDEEDREKSEAEKSIEDFLSSRDIFHRQLTTVHDRLRASAGNFDKEAVANYVRDLKSLGKEYLKSTNADLDRFAERTEDLDDLVDFCELLQDLIDDYAGFVEHNQVDLASIDAVEESKADGKQLMQLNCRMIDVGYRFCDNLHRTRIELARHEERLDHLGVEALVDELTQISSRGAAEAALEDFWRKDPHRQRDLTVAMIDLDEFKGINAKHGVAVGDRLIRAIARIVSATVGSEDLAARFQGQRFLVLFRDNPPRYATPLVEKIRQIIEEATFVHDGTETQLTASCAVSQCIDNDTAESLFARLNETLQEAKRYGRNRTFLQEDKYPAPVVPPNLEIKSQKIEI